MIPAQIKLIIVVALAVGLAFGGWTVRGWRDDAAIKAANDKADAARKEKAAVASKIIEQDAQQQPKIITRTKIVYRKVAAIKGPAQCLGQVPNFREVWNGQ